MNETGERLQRALAAGDYQAVAHGIPYARFLDIRVLEAEGAAGGRIYRMPYRSELIGNPNRPALHGGTIAGLLELSMQLEVLVVETQARLPYPVDFSIDYWRSARTEDCFCDCRLIRSGRRIAQVQAECWQGSRDEPIAFARADFLLRAVDGAESAADG